MPKIDDDDDDDDDDADDNDDDDNDHAKSLFESPHLHPHHTKLLIVVIVIFVDVFVFIVFVFCCCCCCSFCLLKRTLMWLKVLYKKKLSLQISEIILPLNLAKREKIPYNFVVELPRIEGVVVESWNISQTDGQTQDFSNV